MNRRHFTLHVAAWTAPAVWPAIAAGNEDARYPARAVTLVVPYSVGGTADFVARLLATHLSPLLGQPVVVDNRAGSGGLIGAQSVARAPADGYTVLLDASSHAQLPAVRKNMPYDPLKAFAPISLLIKVPNVIVTTPTFPAKTVAEFIKLAKSRPGDIGYASTGTGSSTHLAAVLFERMAGVKLNHIPYKGGGAALTDVVSGQVPVYFGALVSADAFVKSGKLRALAVASLARAPAYPDIPTIAEVLPGYEVYEWNAVFVRSGTPAAVVDKLGAAVRKVLSDDGIRAKLAALGAEVSASTPEALDDFRRAETRKWAALAAQENITQG